MGSPLLLTPSAHPRGLHSLEKETQTSPHTCLPAATGLSTGCGSILQWDQTMAWLQWLPVGGRGVACWIDGQVRSQIIQATAHPRGPPIHLPHFWNYFLELRKGRQK